MQTVIDKNLPRDSIFIDKNMFPEISPPKKEQG